MDNDIEQTQQSAQPEAPDGTSTTPIDQQTRELAEDLKLDATRITKRADMGEILRKMQEGLIVNIHVSRPRFTLALTHKRKETLDHLGLESMSVEARKVVQKYFRLGSRSLLPEEYRQDLNAIETYARLCIARHSIKSYWGAFVPRTMFKAWEEKNGKIEQEFWALRDRLVNNYEALVEAVVEDSRPLAEDVWRRVMLLTIENPADAQVVGEVMQRLQSGDGKEAFLANYLDFIRVNMPTREEIEQGFTYEVELQLIPLPSQVARDMELADKVYQERVLQDARTQAELQKVTLQEQRERSHQQAKEEMERHVLENARRDKEKLVQGFYAEVVHQINTLINDTASNILASIEEHQNELIGRAGAQLRNFIKQLEGLNFIEDEQVEDQLARLRAVLPPEEKERKDARGQYAKIDTTRMRDVLRSVNAEASQILVDLGTEPRVRKVRRESHDAAQPINLDTERRKKREGFSPVEEEMKTPKTGRKRRRFS